MIELELATLDDITEELKKRRLEFILLTRTEMDEGEFYLAGNPETLFETLHRVKKQIEEIRGGEEDE